MCSKPVENSKKIVPWYSKPKVKLYQNCTRRCTRRDLTGVERCTDVGAPLLKICVDTATDPYAIIEAYILNKGKEVEEMPQVESLTSRYARIYTRFADKNINIIAVSTSDDRVAVVAEYIFKRPKDDKLIWPKIVITAPDLFNALVQVEETIGFIRGEGK